MKLYVDSNAKIGVAPTEKPLPTDSEAVLRVKACGICGSDQNFQIHSGNQSAEVYFRRTSVVL